MSDTGDTLLEFPCDFPIKVMGKTSDTFIASVIAIVQRHAPDFRPESATVRASAAGNYLAITCTLRATGKPQLDALYRELTAHPEVSLVL